MPNDPKGNKSYESRMTVNGKGGEEKKTKIIFPLRFFRFRFAAIFENVTRQSDRNYFHGFLFQLTAIHLRSSRQGRLDLSMGFCVDRKPDGNLTKSGISFDEPRAVLFRKFFGFKNESFVGSRFDSDAICQDLVFLSPPPPPSSLPYLSLSLSLSIKPVPNQ